MATINPEAWEYLPMVYRSMHFLSRDIFYGETSYQRGERRAGDWKRRVNLVDVKSSKEKTIDILTEQFIDQNIIKDYVCVICLSIAEKPRIHKNQKCKSILCSTCLNQYYNSMNLNEIPTCPLRCSASEFISSPLPKKGARSKISFLNLQVKCEFEGFMSIIKLKNYNRHVNRCTKNTSKINKRESIKTVSLKITISKDSRY